MEYADNERRKYSRYDTELQLYYNVKYDINMRVIFRVIGSVLKNLTMHKHSGISKNVSAEGLCFVSKRKLKAKDMLQVELYPPNSKIPVKMVGEVRWCEKAPVRGNKENVFQTGVNIILVNGKSVVGSIYFDNEYKVIWSELLNAIFSSFRAMVKNLKKT